MPTQTDQTTPKTPLPRVAVLLLWYPLFTQPFIFRDVEALKEHLPTEVHTLYGLNLRLCSREMAAAAPSASRLGIRALPRILLSVLRLLAAHPRKFASLWSATMRRKWPSLEILGENLWALLAGIHLAPVLKRNGVDITYAPWPRGTATAARTVWLLEGIPYVTSARADNLSPADPDLVDKLRDARMVRTNNLADGRRILDLLEKNPPAARTPVWVIYNSLTLHVTQTAPVPMEKPARLLAIGRFDVTKGFDVLIRACGLLRDRGVDFHLTLAGGGGKVMGLGALDRELRELTASLGLEGTVSFPGFVDHDALPDLLRAHDAFVAPCVIAPEGQRDGIPNTLIEAMSFGLPVVASDVNALPEIVRPGETGYLVPQRDHEALADAIEALVSDPENARRLGANGARLSRRLFSHETNGRLLADLVAEAFRLEEGTGSCAE